MAEHTPTPWHVYEKDPFVICEGGGGSIGIIEAGYPGVSEAEQIANAAYVVHCVNVHDDLVKALEAIIESADAPHAHRGARATDHDYSLPWEDYTEIPDDDLNNARAALARAKGGEG